MSNVCYRAFATGLLAQLPMCKEHRSSLKYQRSSASHCNTCRIEATSGPFWITSQHFTAYVKTFTNILHSDTFQLMLAFTVNRVPELGHLKRGNNCRYVADHTGFDL